MGESECRGTLVEFQVAETEAGDGSLGGRNTAEIKKASFQMLFVCSILSILILTPVLKLAAPLFPNSALYLDYSVYCVQGIEQNLKGELARELG